jgi:GT2 family glycosyltransferase/glycosyltransferase involved in cell wall biosynthesis/SAM-dependent methyltransferase/tetratricopeptide (TPR) repeat protein
MEFLSGKGRLAVIASQMENSPNPIYECLGLGIPFIASRVGGIPELIAPDDVARVRFDPKPEALAAQLSAALAQGFRAARPSVDASANEQSWIAWHESLAPGPGQKNSALTANPSKLPKVSVCLATFNRPAFLRQALASLHALDYSNFEVVLVDDGSTQPEAIQALQEFEPAFAQRGWKIVRQQNRYLGAARNTAVRNSTGEFLLFMDDDNLAEPVELSTLVKAALHSNADIVTCGMNRFSGTEAPNSQSAPKSRWLPLGAAAVLGAFRNCFGDANALVRRSCFEKLGGFTEIHGVTHEDWEFHAKAVLHGFKLMVVPEFLFWYRVSADSMVRTTNGYQNAMRNIQPYLDAVPEALRNLVLFAQEQHLRLERLARQGNRDMARKPFERMLKPQPNHALARENLRAAQAAKPPGASSEIHQQHSASDQMKREWNARATENARYYVRSTTRDQTEEEFDASGLENVNQCVISDLPRIAGNCDPKTMTMLEIGCGLGRMTKHFAHHFGHVHAIDVSGEMIRQARERLKALSNVSLDETSGDDLSLFADETVDFAFSFIVFQHIPDRAVVFNYIREAHRVLRPGGVFKFQVQGCTEKNWMEAPKDTWPGVTITEEDITGLSNELGFDLLAKSGQGTQYSWYTLRKSARKTAPLRDSAKPPALPPSASSQTERCAANRNEAEPMRAAPAVSVIILAFNKFEFTRKCLEALRQNTPAELCEVIVWDNGSTDGTQAFFQQQSPANAAVRYFRSEENLGFIGGNNAAAQRARGRFLVFLNNDTEPQPGWLEALLQTIESDPGIGAVGAKLIYPNGRLQEAGGIIFRDASGWNYGRMQDPRDPRFNFVREVDYCSAACLLVRTELFLRLGGYDSHYEPAYYEDTELCFALRAAGCKIVYQPRCEIIHHEGGTNGQDLNKGLKQHQVINQQKFFDRWKKTLAQHSPPDPGLVRHASHRVRGQRILVIDPVMPMYDRASGSKRLFEILKLLAAAGHAVTFIARNGQDGGRYAAELEQLGVEVYAGDVERMKECGFIVKCWPLDLQKLLQDSQYDTVILSFWYVAEQYLPRIRAWSPTSRVLIDTVDVHFLRERRQAELYKDQKLLQRAEDTYRRELKIYGQGDALITVTEDDRRTLLRELPESRIFIVPNIHDLAKDVPPVNNRDGLLFVGGFGHPPNEDAVLYFYREIWPRILQRVPGARWTIVGNKPPATVQALVGGAIQVTGYVPSVEPYLCSHLISVAPLRYGAGMKGKIGEALAHGLPVVTTSIGAEGMSLQSGDGGALVADDAETFAAHVAKLYADRELWNQLSAQGRRHIESHFTPQCVGRQLEKLLDWSASFTSIIVLAHNQWEDTGKCVQSIARHTPEPHEIILVDNGSTDQTPRAMGALLFENPRVRVIINRDNRGFAAGNNQGLAIARGDNVVLLNNDTVVTPGWLTRLLAVLKRHPDTGIVGPMSNQVSGPQFVNEVSYTDVAQLPAFAESWAAAHDGQSFELGRAVGFCLLARREVIKHIGGLDERFGNGNFEDDDFCIRAQLAGFRIRAAKDAFIHHTGGQTFKGAKIDYRASLLRNWELFKTKWAMPKDLAIEKGYRLPTALPSGGELRIPLPEIQNSHNPSLDGRVWKDKTLKPAARPKSAKTAPIQLPPCALLGNLREARELLKKKQHRSAWEATLAALQIRPFHPEAHLLLAQIAQAAGAGDAARQYAHRARNLVPEWRPARQFLNGCLRGQMKPEWLAPPPAPPAAPRLSVCLIVKNEEQFLGQCLQSVRDIAHQIVVVDTGSTDQTVEIAKKFNAETHFFAWNDDFSAARNEALKYATGDWVLSLDADEELLPEHRRMILEEMQSAGVMGYRLPIIDQGLEQEGCSYVPRLFRNAPGLFFVGRVHEQIFSSLEVRAQEWGLENRLGRAALLHHGYRKEVVDSRSKAARNLRLLQLAVEELPDEPNLVMNLGLELIRSGQLEEGLEQYCEALRLMSVLPPRQVTPELRETLLTQLTTHLLSARRFSEIVALWRQPFIQASGLTASQHFMLGLAQMELKQPAAAAEQMRQCLAKRRQPALSPINKEILKTGPHHCLALSLAALKQDAGAEQAFRDALGEDAKSRAVRFDFAKFQFQHGRPIEALKLMNELVAEDCEDIQAWLLGGQIALSQPEFLEFARDWTGEAVKHFPEDCAILLQRAEALTLNQQAALALPLWTRAHFPNSARHLAALTLCEVLAGQCRRQFAPHTEKLVSQEFLNWYRHLIKYKAHSLVNQVNEKLDDLRAILPAAAGVLGAAMKQAEAVMAV